ncbi:MAG: diaminopimelate epimerase [Deltaproteobacteria bacterium]|jgi:diaminopimelate epimerase|nr:diaminopimelate epimerase [Deltaproteobacteria bacterium]
MPSERSVVPFHKLHSCGKDFVFIDNRGLRLPVSLMPDWARTVCRRVLSIGADGLVFLEAPPAGGKVDYAWHFYTADGTRAEMCGNASRCAALLAVKLGLAGSEHAFGTDAGPIRAQVDAAHSSAKVELTRPHDLALDILLDIGQTPLTLHSVNTGAPHAVVLVKDISKAKVRSMGAALRYHQHFAPAGTHVNFISVRNKRSLAVRTYERDVEDETPACATGAAAAAFVAHALGLADDRLEVSTLGGDVLGVSIEEGSIFLAGKVFHTFSGQILPAGLELSLP